MIRLSPSLDLGGDRVRMRDPNDVSRQTETSRALLSRLFSQDDESRVELQLLADEVGMGKTFIALAVAYSVLEAPKALPPLRGAASRVLVLVPQNNELARKWKEEVGELVKRCVLPEHQDAARRSFKSEPVSRPDELVAALLSKGRGVVVAKTSALTARVGDVDTKARITLAALFRHWGRSLPKEARRLLLNGARGRGWPNDPDLLAHLTEDERARLPVDPSDVEWAVRHAAETTHADDSARLLETCQGLGEPYLRGRAEEVEKLRLRLLDYYKSALFHLVKPLPLVIVDEAHKWKNKRHNHAEFARWLAPRSRRCLLLTATPFQLTPSEIVSLLEVGDHLGVPEARRSRLRELRESVVHPALERSQKESIVFSRRWSELGARLDTETLRDVWHSRGFETARARLTALADLPGALGDAPVDDVIEPLRHQVDPELRPLVMQALRLFAFNRDLSAELGRFVVRHRRRTLHRVVRAGEEATQRAQEVARRPDAHVLHASPGLDVRGDAELPLYLLMRATSELEQGKRTASLGTNLTGCYSTFFESAESRSFAKADKHPTAAPYVELLRDLVGDVAADAGHPKMRCVVDDVVERWERGEKSLVFTFRVNTARRLQALIDTAVSERLDARRKNALGGESGLRQLRQSLTSRTRVLLPLTLDWVLWSTLWAPPGDEQHGISACDLRPTPDDYREIAELALRCSVDVLAKAPDRVFLHRAAECAQARRLRKSAPRKSRLRLLFDHVADAAWVERPYGGTAPEDADLSEDLTDERGVHTVYEATQTPSKADIERLAAALLDRDRHSHQSRQAAVIRQVFLGPCFWLGVEPETELLAREHHPADVDVDRSDQRFLHVQLRELTWSDRDVPDWVTRALTFKAMRRTLLREAILVRLLPRFEERGDDTLAELLVKRATELDAQRKETLLRRVGVFVEDLATRSGSILQPGDARHSLYEATKTTETVALVIGDTGGETRARRLGGFNSPLLPEILVCGQVAQEGIDLHRHCSHVVHYDLPWNPATLEQRTGRIDRIGSQTQRLRQLASPDTAVPTYLEVDAPYLAGTYDERVFEELRLRAQTLEVLLGGDLAGSVGADSAEGDGVDEERARGLVPLPQAVTDDLRVDLAVWHPPGVS